MSRILRPGAPLAAWQAWPRVGSQWPRYNIESPQADKLVAWWPMVASYGLLMPRDLSGRGHHATSYSGTPTWEIHNEFGPGFSCLAASTFASVPDHPDFNGQTNFSIAIWARPTSAAGSTYPRLIDKTGAFDIAYQRASGDIWAIFYDADSDTGWMVASGWTLEEPGHVAITYDGETVLIYINGVLANTDTDLSGPLATNANVLDIGQVTRGGILYDARIAHKTWNAADVANLYAVQTRDELAQIPRRVWAVEAAVARRIFITHC